MILESATVGIFTFVLLQHRLLLVLCSAALLRLVTLVSKSTVPCCACNMDPHQKLTIVVAMCVPVVQLTYNGTVPGPTIPAVVGREVLVRFNNKIRAGGQFPQIPLCNTTTRTVSKSSTCEPRHNL